MLDHNPTMKEYAYRQAWQSLFKELQDKIKDQRPCDVEGRLPIHNQYRLNHLTDIRNYLGRLEALLVEYPSLIETWKDAK